MSELSPEFQSDIDTISGIEAVPAILQVICHATGMGFAAVARVAEGRWIACAVIDNIGFGLRPGGELKAETTICDEIRRSRQGVVIDHVDEDAIYRDHPTPAMYGFQSYISMPIIRRDGSMFGTLCAIDPAPRRLKVPGVVEMFRLFAGLIAFHVDATDRLASSEASLVSAQQTAVRRDQFIATLGHDLRNPLASIDAGATLLLKRPLDDQAIQLVTRMKGSVARMARLIGNVLDFARGRLGGGLDIERNVEGPLKPLLEQVAAELSLSHPEVPVELDLDFVDPVDCDRDRIGQLFSNLLGNALTHGAGEKPVRVSATDGEGAFRLSVANAGEPIPPATMKQLFQPFASGKISSGRRGLGLGLFIASEIARAHGGTLTVASTPEETRFTFEMPLHPVARD